MTLPAGALVGAYNYRLVGLSVLISILASYAALDIAGRVTATRGRMRLAWLTGGAGAMGIGIWCMHYIGMLAFSLPVAIRYNWPTVLLSLLCAVLASGAALYVVSRQQMEWLPSVLGSLVMGSGIAGMHYVGMAAMRLPAMCRYAPGLVVLSVILAILISFAALRLTFNARDETNGLGWQKTASALIMGAAIPVMHYTGMAAATFTVPAVSPDLAHSLDISSLGIAGIVTLTAIVLGSTVTTAVVDRRFSSQTSELEFERRYHDLVEAVQVILWRKNLGSSAFTFVNQQAELLLGYPLEQWTMNPTFWLDHTHPDDRALVESGCRGAAEQSQPQQFEQRMITASGEMVWLRTSIRRIAGQTQAHELVGIMIDISERKRAQEAAEAGSRAKREFLNNMSHELRTPINGVLGMAQLVLNTDLTARQREHMETLVAATESLLAIISDILEFSSIETGKLDTEVIEFRPGDILQATTQMFAAAARQKNLSLRSEILQGVPELLIGDPQRVRQVLVNLVGNAVKFTARGEVAVRVTLDSAVGQKLKLRFAVRDTGIGIPPEKQKLIFEPFSQADGSATRNFGGAGLGLAICSRLVGLLGGTLWVDSSPGMGSQFQFTAQFRVPAITPPERGISERIADYSRTQS